MWGSANPHGGLKHLSSVKLQGCGPQPLWPVTAEYSWWALDVAGELAPCGHNDIFSLGSLFSIVDYVIYSPPRTYSFIYTWLFENLKAKLLKSINTWSNTGQQAARARPSPIEKGFCWRSFILLTYILLSWSLWQMKPVIIHSSL